MRLFSLARLKEKILAHTGMSLLSTTMGVAMLGCATVAYATASANLSHAEMDGQSLKIRNILNDFYDDVKKTKYTDIEEKYQNEKFENLDSDVYVKTSIDKKCRKGMGENGEICPFVKVVARVFAKSDINGENELDRIEVNRTFAKYFDRPRVFTKDDTLELGEETVGIRFFAKAQDGEDGQSCGMESKKLKVYNDVTIPAEPRGNGDLFFCGDESQGSLSRDVINASINSPKANLNYYIRNNFKPFSYNEINHQGAFYKFLYLGTEDTLVTLTTEHYSIPDRFQVFYNGERYYDSGFSGGSRIISFQYKYDPNKSRFLVLEMDAPNRGTDWWVRSKCD